MWLLCVQVQNALVNNPKRKYLIKKDINLF